MERNFSIYSILNEAPGDNNQQQQGNGGNEDNFDIDTSLDDIDKDINNTDTGGDDANNNDLDLGGDDAEDTGGEGGGGNEEEDEPVDANTDFFSSLSSEEQAIKISQLKKQYNELYISCDDFIRKISSIETNENNILPISRINSTLETLKTYIADYLYHVYANKSFYENDVMFNRFLAIFKSISNILEDVYKDINKTNT